MILKSYLIYISPETRKNTSPIVYELQGHEINQEWKRTFRASTPSSKRRLRLVTLTVGIVRQLDEGAAVWGPGVGSTP